MAERRTIHFEKDFRLTDPAVMDDVTFSFLCFNEYQELSIFRPFFLSALRLIYSQQWRRIFILNQYGLK